MGWPRCSYEAAKEAIDRRNTRKGGAGYDISNYSPTIFGNPVCDCEDRHPDQKFYLNYTGEKYYSHRYKCENGARKCCGDARGMMGDFLERSIFEAVAARMEPQLEGFSIKLKESLIEEFVDLDRRRAKADAVVKGRVAESRRLLKKVVQAVCDEEAYVLEATELKEAADKARRKLALIPAAISVEEIDFDGVRRTLSAAFDMLRDRVPFVPTNDDEKELAKALRKGVLGIRLARVGRERGSIIAVQWERYFLSEKNVVQRGYEPEIIETECFLRPSYKNKGAWAHMSDLAAEGLHALTDEQWDLIKDELPDLSVTEYGEKRPTETRKIVHLLVFITRMGVPLTRPPEYFGDSGEVYNALLRLVKAGGIEVVQRRLCGDPAWAEGLDFTRFAKLLRAKNGRYQPVLHAARCAESGLHYLTDEQWKAIEQLFEDESFKGAGKKPVSISMRMAMNGIMVKMKTGCGWGKLPASFGVGNELFNLAQRMQYQGVWDAIFAVFRSRFPEMLTGVHPGLMRGWVVRKSGLKPSSSLPHISEPDGDKNLPAVSGDEGRRQVSAKKRRVVRRARAKQREVE